MKNTVASILTLLNTQQPLVCEEGRMPYYKYPQGLYKSLCDLVQTLGPDYCYVDHIEEVLKISTDKLELTQISTYLTWLIRGERFCDGLIAENIENGMLKGVLERLLHFC